MRYKKAGYVTVIHIFQVNVYPKPTYPIFLATHNITKNSQTRL